MGRNDAPQFKLSPDVAPPPSSLDESRIALSGPPLQSGRTDRSATITLPDAGWVSSRALRSDWGLPIMLPDQGWPSGRKVPTDRSLPSLPIVLPDQGWPSERKVPTDWSLPSLPIMLPDQGWPSDKTAPSDRAWTSDRAGLPTITVTGLDRNVSVDADGHISKIAYPGEDKTREFGRDSDGEINKLTTTTPRGKFSFEKEDGNWFYLNPDGSRQPAPDMMLDTNGDFSKVTSDGVALTQRLDGTTYEEEYTAVGARIQRDPDGNPETIKRPDGSQINASYRDGRLNELTEIDGADSITWKHDRNGDWVSNEVPPQTVRDLRVEANGNLTYSVDKAKYTVRANGAEVEEGKGKARFDFDDQGRISSRTSPDGKSTLTFGYHGSSSEPTTIQVVDREKNETRRYIHQPEEGGWTQVDEHNRSLGTWKGEVKVHDDGTYSIKPSGDTWTDYRTDGTRHHEERKTPQPAQIESANRESDGAPTGAAGNPRDKNDTEDTRPARPNLANINEMTDHSFQLKGYMLPSPDQLGAGSCLYMSATGIAEFLLNKSKGIVDPQVGGPTDLSEAWTINLSKTVQLGNNYTDAPELLARAGALPDSQMKFKAYAGSSWMSEPAIGGRGSEKLPPYKKDVLYSAGGEGSQNSYGRMREQDLEHIKKYLRDTQSPVLFVYKPPTANYWHANIITGYNDKTQSFTVRDSSFGQPQTNKPSYNYDGRSPWGARPYRNETQMPYYQVMAWGNHATGYRLADPTGS